MRTPPRPPSPPRQPDPTPFLTGRPRSPPRHHQLAVPDQALACAHPNRSTAANHPGLRQAQPSPRGQDTRLLSASRSRPPMRTPPRPPSPPRQQDPAPFLTGRPRPPPRLHQPTVPDQAPPCAHPNRSTAANHPGHPTASGKPNHRPAAKIPVPSPPADRGLRCAPHLALQVHPDCGAPGHRAPLPRQQDPAPFLTGRPRPPPRHHQLAVPHQAPACAHPNRSTAANHLGHPTAPGKPTRLRRAPASPSLIPSPRGQDTRPLSARRSRPPRRTPPRPPSQPRLRRAGASSPGTPPHKRPLPANPQTARDSHQLPAT
jgi:hypothetical protein